MPCGQAPLGLCSLVAGPGGVPHRGRLEQVTTGRGSTGAPLLHLPPQSPLPSQPVRPQLGSKGQEGCSSTRCPWAHPGCPGQQVPERQEWGWVPSTPFTWKRPKAHQIWTLTCHHVALGKSPVLRDCFHPMSSRRRLRGPEEATHSHGSP